MKFAEDIKLEGVVITNEDSKVVHGDLGAEPWQGVWGLGVGCWPASGATWRAREEGRASPQLVQSWE